MFTAILPIFIKDDSFWSSSQGIKCMEAFICLCKQISEIENYFILTQNKAVCDLAAKYKMYVIKSHFFDNIDKAYSYQQIVKIGEHLFEELEPQSDILLFLDHRNMFLTIDDVKNAISLYSSNPETGVISLALCKDYPCQYKSFFNYLDCIIFNFDHYDENNQSPDIFQETSIIKKNCNISMLGEVCIEVTSDSSHYKISFHDMNHVSGDYVAQIVPFDSTGPLYEQCQEIFVSKEEKHLSKKINKRKSIGILIILIAPSFSGEYDTVEVFTPLNAPWELSGEGTSVIDRNHQTPLFGRQEFPAVYAYDGTINILGKQQLLTESPLNPKVLILKDSFIVHDWVDYLYVGTYQRA